MIKTKTILELEELVWDLAALSYTIGRTETDDSTSQAKYDKSVDKRDTIRQSIKDMFKELLYQATPKSTSELGWGKGKDE